MVLYTLTEKLTRLTEKLKRLTEKLTAKANNRYAMVLHTLLCNFRNCYKIMLLKEKVLEANIYVKFHSNMYKPLHAMRRF